MLVLVDISPDYMAEKVVMRVCRVWYWIDTGILEGWAKDGSKIHWEFVPGQN